MTTAANTRTMVWFGVRKDAYFNPTTVLFLGVSIVFYATFWLACRQETISALEYAALFLSQGFLVFLMFTPIHDATHRAVCSSRLINDLVLWGTWPIFLNSPVIFRHIHIEHHVHTNEEIDPDHYCSGDNLAIRWAKSLTILFNYYFFAFRHFRDRKHLKLHLVISPLTPIAFAALALWAGKLTLFLVAWWLPVFFAIGILGFVNTSWPHHPAKETSRVRNTRILYVPKFLQMIMGNQNLHLVHHLSPTIPWYEYPKYWRDNGEALVAKGAQVATYTKRKTPY
jgi:fatty acid desaturase